jgi:hypothetical protein
MTTTGIQNTATTPASIPRGKITETTTSTEKDMADEETLRQGAQIIKRRFLAWRSPPVTLPAEHVIYNAVKEIVELLHEKQAGPGFDVCIDAVKWQQKPLDCQGIMVEGMGKLDIQECDIPSGPIDIREFTCRRV